MTQDLYETLQVHPRADAAAITAAYERLRALYDPAKLDGAADELLDLARAKRDAIEHAYAVLGDPARRATYDRQLATAEPQLNRDEKSKTKDDGDQRPNVQTSKRPNVQTPAEEVLDYRPLPPANRQERPRGLEERTLPTRPAPGRAATRQSQSRFTAPIMIAAIFVLIIASSLLLTDGGGPPPVPATPTVSPFDQYEAIIPQAQSNADQNPKSAQAWIDLGNVLYDSAQVVREGAPDSPLYQQRLGRWLQATNAYSQALALEPNNAATRADLGASSCFYGAGTGDQSFVAAGTAEVRRAAQLAPNDERVLLSMGHCLVSEQPPQTDEAIKMWRRIVEQNPASPFAAQVKQLIAKYTQ
jgi:tetratricopeptide (TPR) repeat protein